MELLELCRDSKQLGISHGKRVIGIELLQLYFIIGDMRDPDQNPSRLLLSTKLFIISITFMEFFQDSAFIACMLNNSKQHF